MATKKISRPTFFPGLKCTNISASKFKTSKNLPHPKLHFSSRVTDSPKNVIFESHKRLLAKEPPPTQGKLRKTGIKSAARMFRLRLSLEVAFFLSGSGPAEFQNRLTV